MKNQQTPTTALSHFRLLLTASLITVVFTSCGQNSSPKTETNDASDAESVIINGVKWATRNIDKPGTFAPKPDAPGMFYNFNDKTGWSTFEPMINSNGDTKLNWRFNTGDSWKKTNDPSPAGWRVPTLAEIQTLLDAGKVSSIWTTRNGVPGRKFTDKQTGQSLFLPAVGYRDEKDATLEQAGAAGFYWSSTADDAHSAFSLVFGGGGMAKLSSIGMAWYSVRPVAE